MSNVLYATISGWGQVSSEDSDITNILTFDNSAGVAELVSPGTGAANTISIDEVGAQVWISSVTGLVDAYYTITDLYTFGANTIFTIKGDPSNFAVSTGSVTGKGRIEDHYKLCTAVPAWVTGSNAIARWITAITDISHTLSSEVKLKGGFAKSDGISFDHNYTFSGLDKARWNVMNTQETLLVTDEIFAYDSSNIKVLGGIPYMGSYDSPDTAPTLGVYEPTFCGAECLRVDSASSMGGGKYNCNITRGLLGTEPDTHIYGELLFDGFTHPAGKFGKVYKLKASDSCYYDAEKVFDGTIDTVSYGNGNVTQTIQMSDNLLKLKSRETSGKEPASVKWRDIGVNSYVNYVDIKQQYIGFNWKWIKSGAICVRLSTDDSPGSGNIQRVTQDGADNHYYGYVKSTQALELELISDTGDLNAIIVEKLSPKEWNFAAVPVQFGTDPSEEVFNNTLLEIHPYSLLGSPEANVITDVLKRDSTDDTYPAHVFEPTEFEPSTLFTDSAPSIRYININPIDALLQVLLTKFGDGNNTFDYNGDTWDFDVLPPEIGVGIDASELDHESFIKLGLLFDDLGFKITNCFITSEETGQISKWIEKNILIPFQLSICVDNNGKIRITRLGDSYYTAALPILNDESLFYSPDTESSIPVKYFHDTSNLIDRIYSAFKRPWIDPVNEESNKVLTYQYANDGVSRQYGTIGYSSYDIKPDLCFVFNESQNLEFANYYGRYLSNFRQAVPTVEVFVNCNWAGSTGEFAYVDLSRLPNATGTTETNLKGVGLITSRKKDVLYETDMVRVAVIETANLDSVRAFAASGQVDSAVSSTVFDLDPSEFLSNFFAYTSDADTFNVGDFVLLYNSNFELKSFDGLGNPGAKEISLVSGNEINLTSAFTDNSLSNLTPQPGDIILLSEQSAQTVETKDNFMYIYDDRQDQYIWQN